MMRSRATAGLALTLALAACAGESGADHTPRSPAPIRVNECASCGMIVREQPTPRGQVVHRDGTHAWLCSVGDLVAYAQSPSAHGPIEQTWVEALAPDVDPATYDVDEARWVEASSAGFVLGVDREGIMGPPVLSFATASEARAAAARLGGRAASWSDTRSELGEAR